MISTRIKLLLKLENKNLLVQLPCPIGTPVWQIIICDDDDICSNCRAPQDYGPDYFCYNHAQIQQLNFNMHMFVHINESIFLDVDDAKHAINVKQEFIANLKIKNKRKKEVI